MHVDLLGYSLLAVAETRNINKLLTDKATAGVPVRIAIADPDSLHVIAADQAQRPAGRLRRRIATARDRFEPLTADGVQLRAHEVATSHTILRLDEHLLATIHIHATPGFQAPLLHLRRRGDYQVFDQLVAHYEHVWATATPIGATRPVDQNDAAGPDHGDATDGEDPFLDSLDDVWRPGH